MWPCKYGHCAATGHEVRGILDIPWYIYWYILDIHWHIHWDILGMHWYIYWYMLAIYWNIYWYIRWYIHRYILGIRWYIHGYVCMRCAQHARVYIHALCKEPHIGFTHTTVKHGAVKIYAHRCAARW